MGAERVASSEGILLAYHCAANTGYAIGRLERIFMEAAVQLTGDAGRVFHSYESVNDGQPAHLTVASAPAIALPYRGLDASAMREAASFVRRNQVGTVLAFDLPVRAPVLTALRAGGVRRVVSYWGASISDIYPLWLRPLRRLQYLSSRDRPDHFIFESEDMRQRGVLGAGIPRRQTSVWRMGVDSVRFSPIERPDGYTHRAFEIPPERKVIFFSGHLEPRKGVRTLLEVMRELVERRSRRDLHLVVLGGSQSEIEGMRHTLDGTQTAEFVTFAGYRTDVEQIHKDVYVGAIPSTGWDSFTMSSVELMASGVPLLVSDLPGLREAVVPGTSGLRVPPGDVARWADAIASLLDEPAVRDRMGRAARKIALTQHEISRQVQLLAEILGATSNAPTSKKVNV